MDDIAKAQKEAELHADEDKKKREAIDARNHLENAIYQAEKMPDEYKDKISDDDKETIKKAVAAAKEVLKDETADQEKNEAAMKELNDKIMPIGAKMYEQASKDDVKTDTKADSKSKSSDNDEAVEGEVVDK